MAFDHFRFLKKKLMNVQVLRPLWVKGKNKRAAKLLKPSVLFAKKKKRKKGSAKT
jgi:hypothetical protein